MYYFSKIYFEIEVLVHHVGVFHQLYLFFFFLFFFFFSCIFNVGEDLHILGIGSESLSD